MATYKLSTIMYSKIINQICYCFRCISKSLFKHALKKDDVSECAVLQMELSFMENLCKNNF